MELIYKKERICKDEIVCSLKENRDILKLYKEYWFRGIDKTKLISILYHNPSDFELRYDPNLRLLKSPIFNFYNINEILNFIHFLKFESILYYLGIPIRLEQKIKEFMILVNKYIPNYKYYGRYE